MKKSFLILFSIALCSGGVYFWTLFKDAPEEKAFCSLKKGEWEACKHHLLRAQFSNSYSLPLYTSLVESAKMRYQESEKVLNRSNLPAAQNDKILLIKSLNLCGLFQYDELRALFEDPSTLLDPHLLFIKGYLSFINGEFEEALGSWENLSFDIQENDEFKKWYSYIFETVYPKQAREIFLAQAFSEKKEFEKAHCLLEKNCFSSTAHTSLQQLSTMLLGLNHLLEAMDLPSQEQESHFKLALFYFARSTKFKKYPFSHERIYLNIEDSIFKLIKGTSRDREWAFQFIEVFEKWNVPTSLDRIASNLAELFENEKSDLIKKISATCSHHLFYQHLIEAFVSKYEKALELLDLSSIKKWVQNIAHLDPDHHTQKKLYASSIEALPKFIELQDPSIKKVVSLVDFLDSLNLDERYCRHYADLLLHQAEGCWLKNGYEDHGLNLMQLSLKVSRDTEHAKQRIESFLLPLYEQAEKNNLLRRLSKIHDALDSFSLQPLALTCNEKIANHLADAHFLFLSKNWMGSYAHAEWVLKLNPENENARRIAGLSAFYLGDHALAYHLLTPLDERDKAVQYALAFSIAHLESNLPIKQIVQGESTDPYESEE
jgi:hypothetical protein